MALAHRRLTTDEALAALTSVRRALLAFAGTLADDEWIGPMHALANPPLWELGHIVWFQEKWCLRRRPTADANESPLLGTLAASRLPWSDWLFDSSRIPHDARWHAPLPAPAAVIAYGDAAAAALNSRLVHGWPDDDHDLPYYVELCLYHEAMHLEAWWMRWQLLACTPPSPPDFPEAVGAQGRQYMPAADAQIGATDGGFAFDNELPPMSARLPAHDIDRRPVNFAEYQQFVDDGGYRQPACWSPAGWAWRSAQGRLHPVNWRNHQGHWQHRRFANWEDLPAAQAVRHVSAFEAEAYATWRGRRLPAAAEWEQASRAGVLASGGVWEWTASDFLPYPGFRPGPYADYSRPWFGSHREVRGGSVVTHPQLQRPAFRNFYEPSRDDPFVGFRTAGTTPD